MIGFSITGPVIPLFLADDIGVTDPVELKMWIGLINSASSLTMALFAPIWGHLADTFSRRAMLMRAMFGAGIIIFFMTFVTAPWQLFVLKGIQGCLAGTVSAATVLTAVITPAAQVGFTLGLLTTCIAIGHSLGPLVGGLVADFIGYRAAFLINSLALILSGFIVLWWVDRDTKSGKARSEKKFTLLPDIRPILSSPLLISIIVITFIVSVSGGVSAPMLPLFLKELSIDTAYLASSTGVVLGIGAAATAIAAVMVGKFSGRAGYMKTLIFCLSAGAALIIPQTFVTNIYQLAILRALSCFFMGGCSPVINALIAVSSDKNNQGSIYGINSSLSAAGHAVGPMIGAGIAIISFRATFLVTGIFVAFAAWQAYRRRKLSS